MTTRAGTLYVNIKKITKKSVKATCRNKRNIVLPDIDTTCKILRKQLEKMTKSQLIDKLIAYMNPNVEKTSNDPSMRSLPASPSSTTTTTNSSLFRCRSVNFSEILIDSVVPLVIQFLPGQSIHRLKCVSRELYKTLGSFTSANFHRFGDVFSHTKYFNTLCGSNASLIEVKLDTVNFKTMEPETLLQLCRCDYLRSFKLWYRGGFGHLLHNCTVDLVTGKMLDPMGRVMGKEDYSPQLAPPCGKDVLQLLTEKCASTLTELRIELTASDSRSKLRPGDLINLQNLTSLEISMGDPLEVLNVVTKLGKLRKFAFTSNGHTQFQGIEYNPLDSVNYILRSEYLEYVKLSLGKGKILAGIDCPNLRTIEMNCAPYGSGFREFRWLHWYKGFSCIHPDYDREGIEVSNYVSTDEGYIPVELVTDDEHAFYGLHFIRVDPTEVGGNFSWLKVHTKIQFPAGCVIKDL